MTIAEFKDLLLKTECKVFRNVAAKNAVEYILWREIGENSLRADGGSAESCHIIAVDYYTSKEYPTVPTLLTELFGESEIAYSDPDIIYDADGKYTQYAWTCYI